MVNDPNLDIRLGRARSWLDLAEAKQNSEHARFIFYWIAFNALYGLTPIDPENLDKERQSQMEEIRDFLKRVKEIGRLDRERKTGILDKAIQRCQSDGEIIIKDPFLSYQYWEGETSPPHIVSLCEQDWAHAEAALKTNRDHDSFLNFAFLRLTVLRNQIIHGSATANSESRGFSSLQAGVRFLQVIVPVLLDLTEKHGDRTGKWPKAPYPRRGHLEHPHAG